VRRCPAWAAASWVGAGKLRWAAGGKGEGVGRGGFGPRPIWSSGREQVALPFFFFFSFSILFFKAFSNRD